ncbi:YjfB family protein [Halobacillus seohaensis]|uniref:YjfB family protein n=1 Tax=Halobacillus seohaensis TaxID=447421 RepID=A0ABW2EL84_9BACI
MDVAAASIAMSQTSLKQQTSVALMDQVKSDAETKGNQMVEMLSDSATVSHPTKGSQIDLKG